METVAEIFINTFAGTQSTDLPNFLAQQNFCAWV